MERPLWMSHDNRLDDRLGRRADIGTAAIHPQRRFTPRPTTKPAAPVPKTSQ